jgi:hypothetical protein
MKRKMKRYAEGSEDAVGYEEDAEPGDNTKDIVAKRKAKKGSSARKMSGMEFLSKYERSEPSKRMKDEAEKATAKSKSSVKPYAGEYEETREVMSNLTPEQKKEALKQGASALLPVALEGVAAAQIPLRLKQMMRARKIARANEAERAADRAGEAARRGMSRRDIPRYDERYRAGEGAYEQRKAYEDAALSGQMYKKGGKVSSASKRADGCAVRGKTKGRYI